MKPKTLSISVGVFGIPDDVKQKIPIPLTPGKSTDIRIYGERKDCTKPPLKIVILKSKRIPKQCPLRLAHTPMSLIGRVIYREKDGEYTPECMFSANCSLVTLEN